MAESEMVEEMLALVDHAFTFPDALLAEAIGGLVATGHHIAAVEPDWQYRVDGRSMTPGDVMAMAWRLGLMSNPLRLQ